MRIRPTDDAHLADFLVAEARKPAPPRQVAEDFAREVFRRYAEALASGDPGEELAAYIEQAVFRAHEGLAPIPAERIAHYTATIVRIANEGIPGRATVAQLQDQITAALTQLLS